MFYEHIICIIQLHLGSACLCLGGDDILQCLVTTEQDLILVSRDNECVVYIVSKTGHLWRNSFGQWWVALGSLIYYCETVYYFVRTGQGQADKYVNPLYRLKHAVLVSIPSTAAMSFLLGYACCRFSGGGASSSASRIRIKCECACEQGSSDKQRRWQRIPTMCTQVSRTTTLFYIDAHRSKHHDTSLLLLVLILVLVLSLSPNCSQ